MRRGEDVPADETMVCATARIALRSFRLRIRRENRRNSAAGYVPVTTANFDKPPYSTDPAWQAVTRQLRRPDSKPYPIVTNYQEMMNAIGEELVRAFKNEKLAKEALGEAHRRAQELLDKEVARRK